MSPCPDVKTVPITSDTQFIVLACDGIWDVMQSQDCITYLSENVYKNEFSNKLDFKDIQAGMENLFNDCCPAEFTEDDEEGLGTDNMSMILIEINLENSEYIPAKKKVPVPDG